MRSFKRMRYLKYVLAAAAVAMWSVGLVDQLPDLMHTAKYVGISALMVTLAVIA